MKRIIEAMKSQTLDTINRASPHIISNTAGETKNSETGEIVPHVKVEAEIPRGHGKYSLCRIAVKIPNGKILATEEELDSNDFLVSFTNLEITYIDDRGNVYFRADNYAIRKIEGGK